MVDPSTTIAGVSALPVQFAFVIALVKEYARLSSNAGQLQQSQFLDDFYLRLQTWATDITVRTPSKRASANDVLKILAISNTLEAQTLHHIFETIIILVDNAQQKAKRDGKGSNVIDFLSLRKEFDACILDLNKQIGPIREAYIREVHRLEAKGQDKDISCVVLSFDGGGVRSYSSLLLLKALMTRVNHLLVPANVQTVECENQVDALPWDYFDFIFGSSSGGLLAIMLGRLKMDIKQAIYAFTIYAAEIFSRPRIFSIFGPIPWPRAKYSRKTLRRAIDSVVEAFDKQGKGSLYTEFAAQDDICKTAVISTKSSAAGIVPYIFRSYNNVMNPESTSRAFLRNPGYAASIPIWEVATAASAVPILFDPVVIKGSNFTDGGVSFNNPTVEAFYEVEAIFRAREAESKAESETLGDVPSKDNDAPKTSEIKGEQVSKWIAPTILVISIGAGKREMTKHPFRARGFLAQMLAILEIQRALVTDTQRVHESMSRLAQTQNLIYYRFDVEGMENIKLDTWGRGGRWKRMSTEESIEKATAVYLGRSDVKKALEACARDVVKLQASR